MTAHLIDSFVQRVQDQRASNTLITDADPTPCSFCEIIAGKTPAFRVFEDDNIIAILDILPVRRGHVLVIPKRHISRLSELPDDVAGHLGRAVTKVADALTKALNNTRLNVVCNQEYAQAVPHVHYHIIPAPTLTEWIDRTARLQKKSKRKYKEGNTLPETANAYDRMLNAEYHVRDELDDEEAEELVKSIRAKL